MIPPKRIVFSGGGVKVIGFVGSLQVLYEKGYLKSVKEYCGVSAGAFLAFMMAAQVSLNLIESLILELDFSLIRNLTPEGIIGFPETFGLDDGHNLIRFLESILKIAVKMDATMTFAELHSKSPIEFRCWAADLITKSPREFSFKQTPTVRIIDALRATMSLPFYFSPIADPLTGNLLTDGGLHGNLPIYLLEPNEQTEMLALGFSASDSKTSIVSNEISDVLMYMNKILLCLIQGRNKELNYKLNHRICKLPLESYPSWNFELSRDDRIMLISVGTNSMNQWLEKGPRTLQLSRRNSI